jgi:hypothetical protein
MNKNAAFQYPSTMLYQNQIPLNPTNQFTSIHNTQHQNQINYNNNENNQQNVVQPDYCTDNPSLGGNNHESLMPQWVEL